MVQSKMVAIENAWEAIREYVKENYTNSFPDGIQFEWKHEVYYKIAFNVTARGECYISRGSHGWSYDEFIGHPVKSKNIEYRERKCQILLEVVQDWEKIKQKLEEKASKENSIFNFVV